MNSVRKIGIIFLSLSILSSTAYAKLQKKEEVNKETPSEDILPKRGDESPVYEECSAGESTCSWYCAHTKNGVRPVCPVEFSFLEENSGYFLGKDERVIYLTFDAGYENGNIEKILDILKQEEVPAAFFVLSHLAESNPELIKRMDNEGHFVCNHTSKHKDMTKMECYADFAEELKKLEETVQSATGVTIKPYYRPPEGRITEENLAWAESYGYQTVLWSFAYADWDNNAQPNPDAAYQKILDGTHNGEVLLLHPTSTTNVQILARLIETWKSMGYRFGTLDELTGGSRT